MNKIIVLNQKSYMEYNEVLNFINENSDTKIEIPLDSNEIIINTLEKQSTDKEFINKILDCLSILYYINTFYSEKEKIEIKDLYQLGKEDLKGYYEALLKVVPKELIGFMKALQSFVNQKEGNYSIETIRFKYFFYNREINIIPKDIK